MRRRYNGYLGFLVLLKWDGKLQLLRVFEETNWGTFFFFVTYTQYALLLRTLYVNGVYAIAKSTFMMILGSHETICEPSRNNSNEASKITGWLVFRLQMPKMSR